MNLSDLAVRRGVTFTMVFLVIVGFGLFSLSRLQLDLYPDITLPSVVVITNYTGASPEDIETLVTRPIEGAVAAVKDVEEIRSTSKQGVSLVEVKFDWGKDMDQAETDVRRKLEMIEALLPQDADDSIVFAFDPSLQPVVMLMVTGPYPLDELRRIAENDLEPRIARLPGIASAEVAGGLEREVHVELDPTKIAAFGLDVNNVIGAVYRENSQIPGGALEQGTLDFTIQTEGKYSNVEQIGEVVVGMKPTDTGPVPIRLKEVARVVDTFYESQRVLEVDGEPTVWLLVRKQSGANTVRAAEGVIEALPNLSRSVAAELNFKVIFNQADFINESLGNLSSTGLLGVGITFLVLLVFLRNMRSSLIVASAIPLSVVATFSIMDRANMTLNTLSMAGLALAIGMLVDNAIVVLENIFRLRQEGMNAWDAAIHGAKGVSLAVTASTLTTVAVFVPVLFVPGIAGVLFQDMSITICFSLMVSLVVALTFIPLASSRLLGTERATRLLEKAAKNDPLRRVQHHYGRALDWVLAHRWVTLVGLVGALAITALLAAAMPTEFVPKDDQSLLFVTIETPIGNNLQQTYKMVKEAEEHVKKIIPEDARKLVALDVGVGKGFVSIFSKGVHAGLLRVPLVKPDQRTKSQAQYEAEVREDLRGIPGIKPTVSMPFNLMGDGDIAVEIRGHDLDMSRNLGLDLVEKLKTMPDLAEVVFSMDDQKPEVRVRFDRLKMAELGISAAAVGNVISTYFMGRTAGRYAEGGDEYDIVVRYAKAHRRDVDELRKMPIATPSGQVVPLDNIASVDIGLGPVDITRLDQERITTLKIYLHDDWVDSKGKNQKKDLGGTIGRVDEYLKNYPWPPGFSYEIGGSAEDFLTSFRYLGWALLVSVLLVYIVMASQFESFRQPFIIIFAVPLAAIGVVLMFTVTRSVMNISSLVGVIMLAGIVVNNGIVMIDAANQLRDEGKGRLEAIAIASRIRLRPIILTSATTVLAMLPLALGIGEGAAAWSGMAKAVIGGLTVS
ncbi:MAG TPA: efflux RND transporter permease subunit, partial [Polyangiaceae bacterium]|nr:efflux RND transporter permease subunit [Polyangiaceae bacterium]